MTRAGTRLGSGDVLAAAERIAGHARRTPLLEIAGLPGLLLKGEHLQRGGSFKARGAANAILARGAGEIVTGSSGNHGIAVAGIGRTLGIAVTVVMAAGVSPAKTAAIRGLGARVVAVSGGVAERDRHARELAADTGAAFVPSSDHELVAAGQGTLALEIAAELPDVNTIFVPVGGGGLLAGVCLAAQARPVRIVGVEPMDGRRYFHSIAAGRPVELPPPATIADGLRGQCPGELLLPIIATRADELVGVTDVEIERALGLLRAAGIRAEPSGAVALAGALRTGYPRARRTGRAVAVVSGGNTG